MTTATPTRPNEHTPGILREAAELFFPDIKEWFGADYRPEQEQQIKSDLEEVLDEASFCDGYELAKHLDEYKHWSVDAALVEIMESADYWITRAVDRAVAAWITENGVTPQLTIGSVIIVDGHEGTIYEIDMAHGTYSVCVPGLGHVPKGTIGTQGRIIRWEDATPATEAGAGANTRRPLAQMSLAEGRQQK